jgi:hypothetical protein
MRSKLLPALALLALSSSASASLVQYSGSFSASGFGSLTPSTLDGSWSFEFDHSVVTDAAFEDFAGIPLTSLTLTPNTIGGEVYTVSNSTGYLAFLNGVLNNVIIGGGANAGSAGSPFSNNFQANYWGSTQQINFVLISNGSGSAPGDVVEAASASGSYTATPADVPLPGTALLALGGLVGLGITRRLRARR